MTKEIKVKEYMYTFVGGGWNTEYAKTKRSAIKQAKARWADCDGLEVNEASFHIPTETEMLMALSLFY